MPVTETVQVNGMTDRYPSVHEAWTMVMRQVTSVGKGDFNEQQGFRFRGIDSVLNAVGPALREHGVRVTPDKILDIQTTEYATSRGSRMVNRCITIRWKVTGPAGDDFFGESIGEAADAGDKSMSKAQSVAYRMFLIEALSLPTGDPDPDSESHERAAAEAAHGIAEGPQTSLADQRKEYLDAQRARAALLKQLEPYGWTADNLVKRFKDDYGEDLLKYHHAETIAAFGGALEAEAMKQDVDDALKGTNA